MTHCVTYLLQNKKATPLRDELPLITPELSWTHCRLLLKGERPDVRKFYIDECITGNGSTRQLKRRINSFYYERLLSTRNKGGVRYEIKRLEPGPAPNDIIKDPYVLEFLNAKENVRFLEKDLEDVLIGKLQDFLLGLGKGFPFVGRQQQIASDALLCCASRLNRRSLAKN